MRIVFGTWLGQEIALRNVDCEWDFGGTLSGYLWTNWKIANGWHSIYLSELEKKRPGECELQNEDGGEASLDKEGS